MAAARMKARTVVLASARKPPARNIGMFVGIHILPSLAETGSFKRKRRQGHRLRRIEPHRGWRGQPWDGLIIGWRSNPGRVPSAVAILRRGPTLATVASQR